MPTMARAAESLRLESVGNLGSVPESGLPELSRRWLCKWCRFASALVLLSSSSPMGVGPVQIQAGLLPASEGEKCRRRSELKWFQGRRSAP